MEERRNSFGRIEGRIRAKKLNARVDLTAMVSISFLLIVFFMLTSYMSIPQAVDLGMPDLPEENDGIISCGMGCYPTINLLLDDNDRLVYYLGYIGSPLEGPKELEYGKNGLRKELMRLKTSLFYESESDRRIVVIKPSKKSNYKNLVDVLDEMAIGKVPTYAIVDINTEEEKLLAEK
jgi:biopolymer transport protein ExbD